MGVHLVANNYGKAGIRLLKVTRHGDRHETKEVSVRIQFEGELESGYTVGDNSQILPTDTMKNTTYVFAKDHPLNTIEEFGTDLAQYFLENNSHITRVTTELREHSWHRISLGSDGEHPHAFTSGGDERRIATVVKSREELKIQSGIENLVVMKTTKSGFENFPKDKYTTLPETADRVLATRIEGSWHYQSHNNDYMKSHTTVRQTLIKTFAEHDSRSMQHTLFAMGEAILNNAPEIAEVSLNLPNIHYIPFDLGRFGIENNNEIFYPTDEPYGLIRGTVRRED